MIDLDHIAKSKGTREESQAALVKIQLWSPKRGSRSQARLRQETVTLPCVGSNPIDYPNIK